MNNIYNKINIFHAKIIYIIQKNNTVWISSIIIDEKYRHKSYIRKIIEYFLETYSIIELECWFTLRPMYEHLGFKYIGDDYNDYKIMRLKKEHYIN